MISVTYGGRYPFVQSLVRTIAELGIRTLILYDNNPRESYTPIEDQRVQIVQIGTKSNEGTAKAYSVAIERARSMGFLYAFLLDDDNLPSATALTQILQFNSRLIEIGKRNFAISCEREGFNRTSYWLPQQNKSKYVNISLMGSPSRYPNKSYTGPIKVMNAPYGGLFLPLEIVETVGLPNEEFFLYVDDLEFTGRISDMAGGIFLCSGAWVYDQEPQGKGNRRSSEIADQVRRYSRIYYAVRNQIYFDKLRKSNIFLMRLNSIIFLTSVFVKFALKERSIDFLRAYVNAIYDGERSKLGKTRSMD